VKIENILPLEVRTAKTVLVGGKISGRFICSFSYCSYHRTRNTLRKQLKKNVKIISMHFWEWPKLFKTGFVLVQLKRNKKPGHSKEKRT